MNIDLIGPVPDTPIKPTYKYTLWCFYDREDNLLFVSKNVNQANLKDTEWWYDKAYIKCTHYASAGEVEDAKFAAMQEGKSRWNTHNNDRSKDV